MPDAIQRGVLLVNLGSPDSPAVGDVRRYLREFLMDGRVLDAPFPIRFFIVNFGILPRRPRQSALAYQKIWTPHGSPLVVTSTNARDKLAARLDIPVELAMRYRNPSIPNALANLRGKGVKELLVIPLFPHYAMSSYETAAERVKQLAPDMRLTVQPPFYDYPKYLQALTASAAPALEGGYDRILFSYHGIPQRHLEKADSTHSHCLKTPYCCSKASPAHATCYLAQCIKTTAMFIQYAGAPLAKCSISFQSRLGREPWLSPSTEAELVRLAKSGVKKLVVICPAFVADCLETLEEIGMRGRKIFIEAGGSEMVLVPCLNEHPLWIDALEQMVADWRSGGSPPS